MSFSGKMKELRELEEEIARVVGEIKRELADAVAAQPFRGTYLSDGKDGGPFIALVKFSEVQKSKNWSPEYHIPAFQAAAVLKKLEECKTIRSTFNAVQKMIVEKKVKIGSNTTYLNEETIRILRESDIGKYICVNGYVDIEK